MKNYSSPGVQTPGSLCLQEDSMDKRVESYKTALELSILAKNLGMLIRAEITSETPHKMKELVDLGYNCRKSLDSIGTSNYDTLTYTKVLGDIEKRSMALLEAFKEV